MNVVSGQRRVARNDLLDPLQAFEQRRQRRLAFEDDAPPPRAATSAA